MKSKKRLTSYGLSVPLFFVITAFTPLYSSDEADKSSKNNQVSGSKSEVSSKDDVKAAEISSVKKLPKYLEYKDIPESVLAQMSQIWRDVYSDNTNFSIFTTKDIALSDKVFDSKWEMYGSSFQEDSGSKDENDISVKLDMSLLEMSGENEASKYLEYRDVPEALLIQRLEISKKRNPNDKSYFKFVAKDATQDDQKFDFVWGMYGIYDFTFSWERIPHRFGFNGSTLYSGLGGNNLTLSNSIQSALQSSTSTTTVATNFKNYVNEGSFDLSGINDVMLLRDRFSMGLNFYGMEPWKVFVGVDYEDRSGTRPMYGNWGFSNSVQLLEPIDYSTWDFNLAGSYAKDPFDFSASYTMSSFVNANHSLTYDNPFRNVDSTSATAYSANYASGSSKGRHALDSNNSMQQFSLKGGYKIDDVTRLTGETTWSWRFSDIELLPYTINSAIKTTSTPAAPFNASDKANLPQSSFDGEVLTSLYQANVTRQFSDDLDAKLSVRYYNLDDKSDDFETNGFVRADGLWDTNTAEHEHLDYTKQNYGLTGTYKIRPINSRLMPTYQYEKIHRKERQVKNTTENTVGLGLKTDWNDQVATEAGYSLGKRNGGSYEVPTTADLTFLRMYDQSDRDTKMWNLGVSYTPLEWLDTSISYTNIDEDFDTNFGLKSLKSHEWITDLMVKPVQDLSVTLFYGLNNFNSEQQGRQWTPNLIGDPSVAAYSAEDTPSNWTVDFDENVYTLGLRPVWYIKPNSTKLTLNYLYIWNRASIDIDSAVGTAANDNNAFVPGDLGDGDVARRQSIDLRLDYVLNPASKLYIGFSHETFVRTSYKYEGITDVPVSPAGVYAGAYEMGITYEDARVNLIYLGYALEF
ncbi:MAG: MtrB/PioB family outer membrane beta-barrel protein [Planctomycetes bacterium]|nr:MtrB/PioB family outer membrane beta-barrel protein [Planctomycetota bacterium]